MKGTPSWIIGLLVILAIATGARADTPAQTPDFKEVYDTVRDHLSGTTEADLNRAAVQGFLASLGPKVTLVSAAASSLGTNEASPVTKSSCFEDNIAYLRIARVQDGLAKAVREACTKLAATNKLEGVVLDLRYADGTDYAAAVAAAELFVKKDQPLLDWGQGVVRSREKTDALTTPVAVLVNQVTAGAAEALAAVLRETGAGLILGHKTAGQAMVAHEFPLKDGQTLRIATAPIKLGNGSALSAEGLTPDIAVEVSAQDEKAYFADAYQLAPKPEAEAGSSGSATNHLSGTNRVSRRSRYNEAELVRERKEGTAPDLDLMAGRNPGHDEPPMVQDPALARALDVLKGLAVVRHSRS